MKNTISIEPLESRIAPATLTVTNLADAGAGSLRSAINAAHDGDSIVFKTGLTGLIHIGSTLNVDDSLTINGGGKITLDGGDKTRIFDIDDHTSSVKTVSVSGLTLRNGLGNINQSGNIGFSGGAVIASEAVTIKNCRFAANTTPDFGGAIYAPAFAKLTVTNCDFSANRASAGGAISAIGAASFVVQGGSFTGNYAQGGGGAIYSVGGDGGPSIFGGPAVSSITIFGAQFYKNTTPNGNGGALILQSGDQTTINVLNSSFSTNSAADSGAIALYASPKATATFDHCVVEKNVSTQHSTIGIVGQGKVVVLNSTIKNNQAVFGGGIDYQGGYNGDSLYGSLTVKNTLINGNTASLGGGLYFHAGTLTLDHSTITSNAASNGGGIYRDTASIPSVLNNIASIIKNNLPNQIVTI